VSSGTPYDPNAARNLQAMGANRMNMAGIARLGMTPRQQDLNRHYAFYRAVQYDSRKVDWNGQEHVDPIQHEAIATAGFVPSGFYDAGATLPLKFRRPSAPYHLCKVVVDRFTGLLFSERRHPRLVVEGDQGAQAYAEALAESARLWQAMIRARTLGGAMGTAVVGFQFVDGQPIVEPLDPRWVFPKFKDRWHLRLESIEVRYQYPEEVQAPDGRWEIVPTWYRRTIDEAADVLYEPAPVADNGAEPDWAEAARVEHGLGFCPVLWVQNLPVEGDVDGDPDCHGIFEMTEAIDSLLAQANRGTLANCFGAETPFLTRQGVRRFSDFRDGDEVMALSHVGVWRWATVRKFGRQSLHRVTLQRGPKGTPVAVRATRDHSWILADGSRTTCLQLGDRLAAAPSTFAEFDYASASPAERGMWCRGFVWGDGCNYTSGERILGTRVRLCGRKAEYSPRFAECGYTVRPNGGETRDMFAYVHGPAKALPSADSTPLNLLRAFVRGYVDADATRSRKKTSTRWHRIQVTGEDSIKFVRNVFPAVGLYVSGETDMTGEATNYGVRTAPTVRFAISEQAGGHPNSGWRVTSIEGSGAEDDAWCLVVEGDHSFSLPFGVATGNCDPTLLIRTDNKMGEVGIGSDNAIKVETGGGAEFLELQGTASKAAVDLADKLRAHALEVAQCVLEHPDAATGDQTATEVERRYESMMAKADVLREQYGERCVKPLLEMMMQAALKVTQPRTEGGQIVRPTLSIVGSKGGGAGQPLQPPKNVPHVRLVWPPYFEPTAQDALTASQAVANARAGKALDAEHAANYLAPFFRVEDVKAMLAAVDKETAQEKEDLDAGIMKNLPPNAQRSFGGPKPAAGGKPPGGGG
jgi:hypothetical protein